MFTVRPAAVSDVDGLVALLGQRAFFTETLARPPADGVLLVGVLDGQPVGDVWVSFSRAPEAEVNRYLPGVPMLVHLEVVSVLRGRGYGTALVGAAEDLVRSRGYARVVLGVGIDNPGARRLYERLGYAEWPHGQIDTGYHATGDDGVRRWHPETITMLVKALTAESGNPSPVP
ncbi:Acetyltransferase (GNAT) family protein [Asanoa hainanensis]|uniref:Acetyltransferase (GNAT) family protein n=1 Tax=Asanoa hainanensis TaxID=560556 RepID=A0A239G606_9ACTN|nr:GNAT family N-acetyltransferase [Asanoa hainanensis]SNS64786.1 Acetyltransferase (GNAT) family protein [Asanoa hainanensis]